MKRRVKRGVKIDLGPGSTDQTSYLPPPTSMSYCHSLQLEDVVVVVVALFVQLAA